MTEAAPFFHDIAQGPPSARAFWVRACDGVRLRLAIWPEGTRGTVLLFPGRTEYVEKYGRTAGDLATHGYATITLDWRGQGLADRVPEDRRVGYVGRFSDFQLDVAEMLALARAHGLPEPYYLLAHSMGGSIGLTALHEDLPVNAAVFSAPMWGISMAPHLRPAAWVLSWASRFVGQGERLAPGTKPKTYVCDVPFEGNMLTTDPDMFAYMRAQLSARPDLALGGPSLNWLYEALRETHRNARLDMPDIPALTLLGAQERIVDARPIHAMMARWPGSQFEVIEGAEHEVLMETPAVRARVIDASVALFGAHVSQ